VSRRLVAKLCIALAVSAMAASLMVGLTDPKAAMSGRAATAGTLNR
jgi:hypothetical protein